MKELVERLVQVIVDHPEEVDVREVTGSTHEILEIKVSERDMGHLIGKKGANIIAIRTIVGAAGKGKGKRYIVEVLEERRSR
ncbi:MAG: KH domain-containing protein [Planctomycetota bacterium]|jgi:predicted RNA-binding protein YlqC (UPF0109 family)